MSTVHCPPKVCQFSVLLVLSVSLAITQPSLGNEALLKRSFYAWQEYQNISVTGVITYYEDGKLDKTTPFKYNFAEGKNGSLPLFEMLFYVPNPGEPLSCIGSA